MALKLTDYNGRSCGSVSISGNFTIEEVEELRNEIKAFYDKNVYQYLFDFSNCTFMDSTGLGMLVSIYKRCVSHGGAVMISRPSKPVQEILHLTRLDTIFTMLN